MFQGCRSLKEGVFPPQILLLIRWIAKRKKPWGGAAWIKTVHQETQSWPDIQRGGTLYGCQDQQHFSLHLLHPVPWFNMKFERWIAVPCHIPHRPPKVQHFAEPYSSEVYPIGWAEVLHWVILSVICISSLSSSQPLSMTAVSVTPVYVSGGTQRK